MLEEYFAKPSTIDRIRGLVDRRRRSRATSPGSSSTATARRAFGVAFPIAFTFGEFARSSGVASSVADLPAHLEAFVAGTA